jgi:hypothetical protein
VGAFVGDPVGTVVGIGVGPVGAFVGEEVGAEQVWQKGPLTSEEKEGVLATVQLDLVNMPPTAAESIMIRPQAQRS